MENLSKNSSEIKIGSIVITTEDIFNGNNHLILPKGTICKVTNYWLDFEGYTLVRVKFSKKLSQNLLHAVPKKKFKLIPTHAQILYGE